MDRSIEFYLIKKDQHQDELMQWVETVTRRPVYGQIGSVSASEFFSGGQNGFKPEWRVTMFGPDYEGEDDAEIYGVVYSIYRVYRARNDRVELYMERRTGDGD